MKPAIILLPCGLSPVPIFSGKDKKVSSFWFQVETWVETWRMKWRVTDDKSAWLGSMIEMYLLVHETPKWYKKIRRHELLINRSFITIAIKTLCCCARREILKMFGDSPLPQQRSFQCFIIPFSFLYKMITNLFWKICQWKCVQAGRMPEACWL